MAERTRPKRIRKLVATVERAAAPGCPKNDWTMTVHARDGRFVALVVGKPGFVLDAQRAALTGGARALRAFPAGVAHG